MSEKQYCLMSLDLSDEFQCRNTSCKQYITQREDVVKISFKNLRNPDCGYCRKEARHELILW